MMPKTMPMVAKSAVFGQGGLAAASCCKPRTAEGQGIKKRMLAMAGIAIAMAVTIGNSSIVVITDAESGQQITT